MRILVAYGTKTGGTAEIAQRVGDDLSRRGLPTDVRSAATVTAIDRYDAVVVGGAVYGDRWHRDARRFVRRHCDELRDRPVWFFSSGPVENATGVLRLDPVPDVRRLMDEVPVRGHETFGGRLDPDPHASFVARLMADERSGTPQDPERIDAWADDIALEIAQRVALGG